MSHSDKTELFKKETIKFNKKHNLISKKNTEKIIDEAIEEAKALTKHLKQYKNILDIVQGVGSQAYRSQFLTKTKTYICLKKTTKKTTT